MGLKLGKMLKQVSFKNAVKLAAVAVPGVGGSVIGAIQQASEAKKQAKNEQEIAKAQAMADNVGAQVGDYGGTVTGRMLSSAGKAALAKVDSSVYDVVGVAGAKTVDYTIKQWFISKKKIIIYTVGGLVVSYFIYKRMTAPKYGKRKY